MKEFFSHPHFGERPSEDVGIPDNRVEQLQLLERIEEARATWIGALETLSQKVPHDDVILDNRTLAYDVLRNSWFANLMELADLEEMIRERMSLDAN